MITLASSSSPRTHSTDSTDKKTSKINRPPSPSLLEVIRLLLQRVERTSYPNNDPIAIENLKAHLRARIADLDTGEGKKLPSPEAAKRFPLRNTAAWQQVQDRQSRSPRLPVPFFRAQMTTRRFETDRSHDLS